MLFGSLRASDMIDNPAPSHESLFSLGFWLHLGQNPDPSDSAGATVREKPLTIAQDNISIYKRILHAISMSVSYFLAETDYYVPLSSNVFLGPRPAEDYALRHDAEQRDISGLFNTFCLEVQWLPCGTLLIYSYPDPGIFLHNLGEVLSTHDRDAEFELQLAPFGTFATPHLQELRNNEYLRPIDEAIESNEDSRLQSLKPSVSLLLEQHGLQLSDHCEWLRVNIKSPVNEPSSPRSGVPSSGTILWPAHLCFYEDMATANSMDSPPWLWPGLEKGAIDPLKMAETWFLERDTRNKAIEEKRAGPEAQSRLDSRDLHLDDDDLLTTSFLPFDRHLDIQGANNIYPTPPDGFQAQPSGHGSDPRPYDQTNIHTDTEMLDLVEDQSTELEQTDQQQDLNLETGMSLGAYADMDDDLFDDMDSAMFTAKGITEDDFDFFDGPEESTFDRDPNSNSLKAELEAGSPAARASFAKPTKSTNLNIISDEPYSSADVEDISVTQTTPAEDKMDVKPNSIGNQSSQQLSPEFIEDDPERYVMPTPLHDVDPSTYPTSQREQTSRAQRSVFGSIPLWEASRNLDQKYKDRGRFSIDIGVSKNDLHHEPDRLERFIPLLGQTTNTSDDELDSDEGQQVFLRFPQWSITNEDFPESAEYATNEPRTPKSSTAYEEYGAIADNTKAHLPQTPLSPQESDLNNKKLPMLQKMLHESTSTPHDASPTDPVDLTTQIYYGHDEKFIQVAQILADQLLVYSKVEAHDEFFPELGTKNIHVGVQFEDPLRDVLGDLFPRDEICTLETCAGLSESPRGTGALPKVVPRPFNRKQDAVRGPIDTASCPSITSLGTPNLRVIRGDTLMDISSTALHFWEELGLNPCMGPKDVTAFCVYPGIETVRRGSATFMNLVSSTFQCLRLGAYSCGCETLDEYPEGLVPVSLEAHDIEGAMQEIDAVCEYLGTYRHQHEDFIELISGQRRKIIAIGTH